MGQLLPVLLLLSGFTFSVCRPPSKDGSKSLVLVAKASQVKGPAVPRMRLQVQPPLLLIIPLPHPHTANSPLPHKALASKSMHKGNKSAMYCLSLVRSPRSSGFPWRSEPFSTTLHPAFPFPTFPGQFPSPPIRACRTPFAPLHVSHLPPSLLTSPNGIAFTFVNLLMLQMNNVLLPLVAQACSLGIRDQGRLRASLMPSVVGRP